MKQMNVSLAITHLPALENMKREARGSDLVIFVIWALDNPVGVTGIISVSVFTISCGNMRSHQTTQTNCAWLFPKEDFYTKLL